MFEQLLADVLNRVLGDYIANLERNQLTVGIWAGDVKLRNLKLRTDALHAFAPVDVDGQLGELSISIPWQNLKNMPVVIHIDSVILRARAMTSPAPQKKKEVQKPPEQMQQQSFFEQLVTKIVDNLQFEIGNVRVEYEDETSLVGVYMEQLSAASCDSNWKEMFVESTDSIYKLIRMSKFSVFYNTNTKQSTELHNGQFILNPISGECRMRVYKKRQERRIDTRLLFDDLSLDLDDQQYKNIVELASLMRHLQRRRKYPNRPKEPVKGNTNAYWKFAIKTIVAEIHDRHYKWSWDYFKTRRDNRLRYIQLYKKKKINKLKEGEDKELEWLEDATIEYDEIVLYRQIADKQLKKELPNIKPQQTTWYEWWSGQKTQGEGLTEEQKRVLYETIDYSEQLEDVKQLPDSLSFTVDFELKRGCLRLMEMKQKKRQSLLQWLFIKLQASYKLKNNGNFVFDMDLNNMKLIDDLKLTQFPTIVEGKIEQNSLFHLKYEQDTSCRVDLKMKPLKIVYNKQCFDNLQAYFKKHTQVELDDLYSSEDAKKPAAVQVDEKQIDITIDLESPLIILPVHDDYFIADLGHLKLNTAHDDIYDVHKIKLTDLTLEMKSSFDNVTVEKLLDKKSDFKIISNIDLDLKLYLNKLQSYKYYYKTRVEAHLPLLELHVSPEIVGKLKSFTAGVGGATAAASSSSVQQESKIDLNLLECALKVDEMKLVCFKGTKEFSCARLKNSDISLSQTSFTMNYSLKATKLGLSSGGKEVVSGDNSLIFANSSLSLDRVCLCSGSEYLLELQDYFKSFMIVAETQSVTETQHATTTSSFGFTLNNSIVVLLDTHAEEIATALITKLTPSEMTVSVKRNDAVISNEFTIEFNRDNLVQVDTMHLNYDNKFITDAYQFIKRVLRLSDEPSTTHEDEKQLVKLNQALLTLTSPNGSIVTRSESILISNQTVHLQDASIANSHVFDVRINYSSPQLTISTTHIELSLSDTELTCLLDSISVLQQFSLGNPSTDSIANIYITLESISLQLSLLTLKLSELSIITVDQSFLVDFSLLNILINDMNIIELKQKSIEYQSSNILLVDLIDINVMYDISNMTLIRETMTEIYSESLLNTPSTSSNPLSFRFNIKNANISISNINIHAKQLVLSKERILSLAVSNLSLSLDSIDLISPFDFTFIYETNKISIDLPHLIQVSSTYADLLALYATTEQFLTPVKKKAVDTAKELLQQEGTSTATSTDLHINTSGLRVLLIDDSISLPLFQCLFDSFKLDIVQSNLDTNLGVEVHYYNILLSQWESLVEKSHIGVCLSGNRILVKGKNRIDLTLSYYLLQLLSSKRNQTSGVRLKPYLIVNKMNKEITINGSSRLLPSVELPFSFDEESSNTISVDSISVPIDKQGVRIFNNELVVDIELLSNYVKKIELKHLIEVVNDTELDITIKTPHRTEFKLKANSSYSCKDEIELKTAITNSSYSKLKEGIQMLSSDTFITVELYTFKQFKRYTLKPSLYIENQLPIPLEYSVDSSREGSKVESLKRRMLYVDPTQVKLRLKLDSWSTESGGGSVDEAKFNTTLNDNDVILHTKLLNNTLTVYTPYLIINKTSYELELKSHSTIHRFTSLLLYTKNKLKQRAQIRFSTSRNQERVLDWSSPFSLDAFATFTEIRFSSNAAVLGVECEVDSRYKYSKIITITPRYIIRNRLKDSITLGNGGNHDSIQVKSGESGELYFTNNNEYTALCINSYKSPIFKYTELNTVFLKNKSELYKVEITNERSVIFITLRYETIWPYRIDNHSSTELIAFQLDSKQKYRIEPRQSMLYCWDEPSLPRVLILHTRGGIEREIPLNEIGQLLPLVVDDSTILSLSVVAEVSTLVLKVSDYKENDSIYKRQSKEFSVDEMPSKSLYEIQLSVSLGVSLVKERRELVYLLLKDIELLYRNTEAYESLLLSVQYAEIDNQLYDAEQPNILIPLGAEKELFQMALVRMKSGAYGVDYYKYLSVLIQEIELNIEEQFLFEMLRFFESNAADGGNGGGVDDTQIDILSPTTTTALTSDTELRRIYFDVIQLQPVKINITFSKSDYKQPSISHVYYPIWFVWNVLSMAIGNVSDAPIRLNALIMEHPIAATSSQLMNLIAQHYQREILAQIHKIIGSADLFGSPVQLFTLIGSGVKDVFYEPYLGIVSDRPQDVGIGLAKGTASFLKKTVYGLSDTIGKMTGSVGKGLASATMDEEYIEERRRSRVKRDKGIVTGLSSGASSLARSVVSGVSGIVEQPLRGAEKEGVGGFFKGIGKGIVGVVTKPVVGVFDMASSISDGVKNTAMKQKIRRCRLPRVIRGRIEAYDEHDAIGAYLLRDYFKSDEYIYHRGGVFVSNRRIVGITKHGVDWQVSLEEYIGIERRGVVYEIRSVNGVVKFECQDDALKDKIIEAYQGHLDRVRQ